MLSGPAAGVQAAARVGEEIGHLRLITLDMGGTSADMAVIDGAPRMSTDSSLGGYPFFMPSVAVDSIGAGGGSIAWVDDQGLLKVGPRSAGAVPGPAAYGRGGEDPTVTDAYLVAGVLGPQDMLGGALELFPGEAAGALRGIASRLGVDARQAADAVLHVATAAMVAELLPLLARHGVDPREFVLVAFGGAGPTHAFDVAVEAGIEHVLVPPVPGAMCALGAALADVQRDFAAPVRIAATDIPRLARAFQDLEEEASRWTREAARWVGSGDGVRLLRRADMRYRGQSYELVVDLPPGLDPAEAFHRHFERVYGYWDPEGAIEVLAARVTAVIPTARPLRRSRPGPPGPLRPAALRQVRYRSREWEVPVYRRVELPPGARLDGPVIVTQYDTTTFVPPGFVLWVDSSGNIRGEARR